MSVEQYHKYNIRHDAVHQVRAYEDIGPRSVLGVRTR